MKLVLTIIATLLIVGFYAVIFGCCVYEFVESVRKRKEIEKK